MVKKWTEKEIKLLKKWIPLIGYRKSKNREIIGTPYILDFFPDRTISSITNKIRKLNIRYNPQYDVKIGYHRCNLCLKVLEKEEFPNWSITKRSFQCIKCQSITKKVSYESEDNLKSRLTKYLYRRSRDVKNGEKVSISEVRKEVDSLLEKYDYECFYKDKFCDNMGRISLTIGHKNPISKGGDVIDVENLFFMCMSHNTLMSTLKEDEFIPSLKSMNKKLEKYFSF